MSPVNKTGSGFLAAGGVAAILASTCCLGPLILVMLGFTSVWIGSLSVLEPYRPLLLGVALVTLGLAAWRIFRPAQACEADGTCPTPRSRYIQKIIFAAVAALTLVAFAFPYLARFFY
jgi:mercuric ion transport protein